MSKSGPSTSHLEKYIDAKIEALSRLFQAAVEKHEQLFQIQSENLKNLAEAVSQLNAEVRSLRNGTIRSEEHMKSAAAMETAFAGLVTRVENLEKWRSYILGALAAVSAIMAVITLMTRLHVVK